MYLSQNHTCLLAQLITCNVKFTSLNPVSPLFLMTRPGKLSRIRLRSLQIFFLPQEDGAQRGASLLFKVGPVHELITSFIKPR